MTSSELVTRARELDKAATPGPWRNQNDNIAVTTSGDCWYLDYFVRCATQSRVVADGEFIAEARSLLPALAAAVEELEAQLREAADAWIEARPRVVELEALNARLTAALRTLLDVTPPGTFAGWRPYVEANQAARALLAETENTT